MTDAKHTPRQITDAANYGHGHLNSIRCDMGDMGDRKVGYSDTMRRDMSLALDLLHAAPCMVEALKQWKCPSCGSRGEYEHHGQKVEYERTGRARAIHPDNRVTACKKCGWCGLHPIAHTALIRASAA